MAEQLQREKHGGGGDDDDTGFQHRGCWTKPITRSPHAPAQFSGGITPTARSETETKSGGGTGGGENQCTVREQDRFMPIANVIRIMRKVLPAHAKISDDAKETIQECVSEYISFITSEANERCQREQRKTITADDVLWAMSKLGFDDYIAPLGVYLRRYRELEGDHRGSIRGDSLQFKRASMPSGGGGGGGPLQPGNVHFAVAAGVYGLPPPAPQMSSYNLPTAAAAMHGSSTTILGLRR
ncbi:Nuclear transcription factor Y subunit B-6 [Platanthera guangdongensis]|uniref:Nuclear transcription factor Y subunit B-6 n=1 Tax=Platanthera guangdongensis TaxID=2320717 RepID=A0ABR2MFH1_9ASPA